SSRFEAGEHDVDEVGYQAARLWTREIARAGTAGDCEFVGIADDIEGLTAHGTILGTLQYMAPEQLEGQEADARSDIFSFGVVLYEMLTGKKAFEGKSQASLCCIDCGETFD